MTNSNSFCVWDKSVIDDIADAADVEITQTVHTWIPSRKRRHSRNVSSASLATRATGYQ